MTKDLILESEKSVSKIRWSGLDCSLSNYLGSDSLLVTRICEFVFAFSALDFRPG